jgi:N-acetylglutamate synthase-like GNAT family acetyltransferase
MRVRSFQKGDEQFICELIYENYGDTYYKKLLYQPAKILELEQNGSLNSIVAEIDNKIVGHFALSPIPDSNLGEVGVAVVDQDYKGHGIMNSMFEYLLKKALQLGYKGVCAEAITFHTFSQKANLKYGFCESALLLGFIPDDIKLKNHNYDYNGKRGAVLVSFKLFQKEKRKITLAQRYKSLIALTYKKCDIPYEEVEFKNDTTKITYLIKEELQISEITIDEQNKEFQQSFHEIFQTLKSKNVAMIYADINLQNIENIDYVVEVLSNLNFTYSGIMYLYKHDKDYLRMQYKNSELIEEKNIILYSDFAQSLLMQTQLFC